MRKTTAAMLKKQKNNKYMNLKNKITRKAIISAIKAIAIIAFIYSVFLIVLHMLGVEIMQVLNFSGSWKTKETFERASLYYYMGNSTVIRVEIDSGTDTTALTSLINLLDSADSNFIAKCTMIRLTDKNVLEAANIEDENSENIKAIADGTKIIFNDEYVTEVIFYHEMSHIYDISHGVLSEKDDFQKLCNDETFDTVLTLAGYVRRDSYESWASGSMLYWLEPEALNDTAPKIYSYFEAIYTKK